MQKLTVLLNFLKGISILLYNLFEFFSFFFQLWSWIEAIPVVIVATWVLIMKLALFLDLHYKVRLPYGLPKKAGKYVLVSVFWVSVVACLMGFVSKIYFGMPAGRMIVLITVYFFLIYNDYRELKRVLRKMAEQEE